MKELLATLLILCAGPDWAEWVLYEISTDGDARFFYDPATVRGENIKRVWDKVELKKPSKFGALSWRAYTEFDCSDGKTRNLQFEAFSKANLGGKTLNSISDPSEWVYVAPQTIEKTLFSKVCGKK